MRRSVALHRSLFDRVDPGPLAASTDRSHWRCRTPRMLAPASVLPGYPSTLTVMGISLSSSSGGRCDAASHAGPPPVLVL